ncbi:hypothetical protein C7E25_23205, partial [Stenotrophomonas maltophilia]
QARERGLGILQAAIVGTREVSMAVVASTLTTIAGRFGTGHRPGGWTTRIVVLESIAKRVSVAWVSCRRPSSVPAK